MHNDEVFLNASEHLFNLGVSETLMLKNYARYRRIKFCTMVGGAESIRDIHEGSNLHSEAFEFNLVESVFALNKILSAMRFLEVLEN